VTLLLAALGTFVVSLDSAVNIAFPDMAAAFAGGPSSLRWLIICYVLTYSITSFVAGLIADRVGPAAVFTTGAWISAGAFLAYALEWSFSGVLALRVIQGIGGGFIYGTAPALVTLSTERERHGRALGLMSLGLASGLAAGPSIGGALVERFGWRAVFLFRAPAAALVGTLALRLASTLAPSPPGGRSGLRLEEVARWPVLGALLLAFVANYAQFAVWLLVPFYLVGVLALPAAAGGLVFMLTPLGAALAAPLGGWLTDRWGPRWPVVAGLVVETLGLFLVSRLAGETALPVVAAALGLVGVGLGVFQVPNLAQVMAAFPPAVHGGAGGLAFMSRTLGVVTGVQMASALFAWALPTRGFVGAFGLAFTGAATVCGLGVLIALLGPAPGRRHVSRRRLG
jgi:MFS family permease